MERIKSIDSTKFVLIALVIFAHALEVCRDTDWFSEKVYVFIYSFHMPAFIMLSGFFFNDTNSEKFWRGVANLLFTYIIFQVALCGNPLTYSTDNGAFWTQMLNGLSYNIQHFYLPAGALWYILSLVFWRLFLHLFPHKYRTHNASKLIAIAFVASILSGFIPLGRELSFQRTFAFYPFFILGYYASKCNAYIEMKKISIKYGLITMLIYAVVIFVIGHFPLSMLVQFFYYSELGNPLVGMLMRIASYFWMLPLTIAILIVFSKFSFFWEQGKNTLFYYIYHMYVIMGMRIVLSSIFVGGVKFIYVLLAFVPVMYVLSLLSKLRFLYKPLSIIGGISKSSAIQ